MRLKGVGACVSAKGQGFTGGDRGLIRGYPYISTVSWLFPAATYWDSQQGRRNPRQLESAVVLFWLRLC